MPPELSDQELATRLAAETRFQRLVHVASCNSTQELAAKAGGTEETVFWSDHQTAGRGRQDRIWDDEPNVDLAVTFRMRLQLTNPVALPAITPLCVLEATEPLAQRQLRLKWPNDVYLDGRKLAGILIDTSTASQGTYLVGIGINVNRTRVPQELEGKATSLALVTGRSHSRSALLLALASRLHDAATALTEGPESAVDAYQQRFRERLGLMNREVALDDGRQHRGVLTGLDLREIQLADGRSFPLGQLRALRAAD